MAAFEMSQITQLTIQSRFRCVQKNGASLAMKFLVDSRKGEL